MRRRVLLLFAVALLLGLGAAWYANVWLERGPGSAPEAKLEMSPVVVAAVDIPFGQEIQATHLKVLQWPKDALPAGVFHDPKQVVGRYASQKIIKDEPILEGRAVKQVGGSVLAAMIPPDMRAVTVRVNDVIGVAGFALPGNRVDIIHAQKVNNKIKTQIILQDLKVLAVDQSAQPDQNKPTVVRAVTLEVTPKQAETLVKATQDGEIRLALRNPLDNSRVAMAEEAPPSPPPPPPKKAEPKKPAVVKKAVRSRPRHRWHPRPTVVVIRGERAEVVKVSR